MRIHPVHIWNWAYKDWKLFLADRQGVFLCFAVPIILASAFSLIFKKDSNNSTLPKPRVLIVLEDQTDFSRQVAEDLSADARLQAQIVEMDQAEGAFQRGDKVIVLRLPADLNEKMQHCWNTGKAPPKIEMCQNAGNNLEYSLVEGVVTSTLMRRTVQDMVSKLHATANFLRMNKPTKKKFTPPFQLIRKHTQKGTNSMIYSHAFCGMTIQYLLFLGMDSGLLLLRERKRGIWRRMRTCPVSLESILLGKSLSIMLIALLQIMATFAAGYLLFGVVIRGSVVGFVAMSIVIAFLVASIGLLVATLGNTESRARSISILVILAFSMIGGLWLPSFLFPEWVQRLSEILPTNWAMQGLKEMVTPGFPMQTLLLSFTLLLLCSAVFLIIALWRFRRIEWIQEN